MEKTEYKTEIARIVYACVSPDTVVTDLVPGKVGIEKARALFWYPHKGVESVFVATIVHKSKNQIMLLFDNLEFAIDVCSLANAKFNEDLQVKQMDVK